MRINLDMDWKQSIVALAEGNPGAVHVMCQMMRVCPIRGQIGLCRLDDMKMYGSKIWVGFKDVCKEDINLFMDRVEDHSIGQEIANKCCLKKGIPND